MPEVTFDDTMNVDLKLTDNIINNIIDKCSEIRENSPDVQTLEKAMAYNEDDYKEEDLNLIEAEVISDIVKISTDFSVEEYNIIKAKTQYNKYIKTLEEQQQDEELIDIENEIIMSLKSEENKDSELIDIENEILNDIKFKEKQEENKMIENNEIIETVEAEVVSEETASFPKEIHTEDDIPDVIDTTSTEVSEEEGIDNVPVDTSTEVSKEEENGALDDVPVTEVEVNSKEILKKINTDFRDLSDEDAYAILECMERYKKKEKFNVFDNLPKNVQNKIVSIYLDNQDINNIKNKKELCNFMAKNFINELINDTYINKEINDFNAELAEATKGFDNISGLIIDTFTDELKTKFEDNFVEMAEKIKDEDPEKAEQLLRVSEYFKASYTLKFISEDIIYRPSLINRAYKSSRKYNQFCDRFNNHFANYTPKIKDLNTIYTSLVKMGYTDLRCIKTFVALIANNLISHNIEKSVEGSVYAYYTILGFVNINVSGNNNSCTIMLKSVVKTIMEIIKEFFIAKEEELNSRKGKKKKN